MGAEAGGRLDRSRPLVSALSRANLEVLRDEEAVAHRAREIFRDVEPRSVVLAGGKTPRRAYELIAELPIDWSRIDFFQSDERWVPRNDERSNARMIGQALGSRIKEARFHPIATSGSPDHSAEDYASQVEMVIPFDLTFLGIGTDGHTASLFADVPNYDRTDVLAFAFESEKLEMLRVTLSLKAINESHHVVFLVTGEEKSKALSDTLSDRNVPAAKVNPIGKLTILADKAAARSAPTT